MGGRFYQAHSSQLIESTIRPLSSSSTAVRIPTLHHVHRWEFQPVWCSSCDDGTACNEDGTPCEANLLLGPSHDAMVRSGGKLDR